MVKCKPGKEYSIVLVALTCTEEVKRERRRKVFIYFIVRKYKYYL